MLGRENKEVKEEMKEPTEAQIKEFWEWCGFERKRENSGYYLGKPSGYYEYWVLDDYNEFDLPPIDLNNLFKYASDVIVDITFRYYPGGCECKLTYLTEAGIGTVKPWIENETGDEKRGRELSNIALFWALWEVKEK